MHKSNSINELYDIIFIYENLFNLLNDKSIGLTCCSHYNFITENHIYNYISETLKSINILLEHNKFTDSFTLVRKLYELVILHIYFIQYKKEYDKKSKILQDINNLDIILKWTIDFPDFLFNTNKQTENIFQLPFFKEQIKFLKKSSSLDPLHNIINKHKLITKAKELKKRSNGFVHHNKFIYILTNSSNIFTQKHKEKLLNRIIEDIKIITTLHMAYLFYFLKTVHNICIPPIIKYPEHNGFSYLFFLEDEIKQNLNSLSPSLLEDIETSL